MTITVLQGGNVLDLERGVLLEHHHVVIDGERIVEVTDRPVDLPNAQAIDVRGKTGEAEFEGGSHSWFAGYRGDMAFAALIVGGGSSEYAVRMLRWMLESLPPDYLA